ncbi:NAD(P)-dependent oxidoreductase, partial [Paenibacillus graminis]
MVKYLPIMLDVQDQRVVVIGGGAVAERKVGALVEAGAAVVLVSPSLTEALAALAEAGRLSWISR